jgi:carbonic anhydrase/acetyltransferase-like protein (isoleucine patch superfamily)
MKYKLTHNTKIVDGITLYQIQAIKDFGDVKAGDVGGWIETECNLSHYGAAWVSGNAHVSGTAQVSGNAWVFDTARVSGTACVSGNAWVYGTARVSGDAQVSGTARVSGNAHVSDNAQVSGNAIIAQNQRIRFNRVINDLTDRANMLENIEAQTGLKSFNNEIYCYKHVSENLSSLHDANFKYVVGDYVSVYNVDLDPTKSCTTGLHVSNAQYWNGKDATKILFCKVSLDDIIAVQEGKIRCKRLFVIGVCDGLVF